VRLSVVIEALDWMMAYSVNWSSVLNMAMPLKFRKCTGAVLPDGVWGVSAIRGGESVSLGPPMYRVALFIKI
jgi:hypothetical protein